MASSPENPVIARRSRSNPDRLLNALGVASSAAPSRNDGTGRVPDCPAGDRPGVDARPGADAQPGGGLAVIIPAANEAARIGACLAALAASDDPGLPVAVIVVANGCRDATAQVARDAGAAIAARGWAMQVLELAEGGKTRALNAGDAATGAGLRLYLDADVTPGPGLLAALARALAGEAAAYASGRVRITGRGAVARAYARVWARVPFMARGVPGCGAFAVNRAGRARWGAWPDIISDDTFARLQFRPGERHLVAAAYDWPVAEGFGALVRVRRRQDRGVAEIAARFPDLLRNDDKAPPGAAGLLRLLVRDPAGLAVYAGVALAVRLKRGDAGWSRGR
ncbi:MAG: glycosyltransferase family 2 protein [Rubellimicrobium sp.]|nr:glycosyltransferase family 2 protein [Rubellimicrobium sp.]